MNGYLLIDKPKSWTSQDVVAYLRGKWKWGKTGHTGTLDPGATGLLVVLIGRATKQFELFQKLEKEYVAGIDFGRTTDTDDKDGKTLKEYKGNIKLDRKKVESLLKKTVGEKWQTPPQISSVKIHGIPAHRLVRKGKTVVLKPKKVTIYAAELIDMTDKSIKVKFTVSSGTYIRSIARTMGEETGYGAHLENLRRTRIGDWQVEDAIKAGDATPDDIRTEFTSSAGQAETKQSYLI